MLCSYSVVCYGVVCYGVVCAWYVRTHTTHTHTHTCTCMRMCTRMHTHTYANAHTHTHTCTHTRTLWCGMLCYGVYLWGGMLWCLSSQVFPRKPRYVQRGSWYRALVSRDIVLMCTNVINLLNRVPEHVSQTFSCCTERKENQCIPNGSVSPA